MWLLKFEIIKLRKGIRMAKVFMICGKICSVKSTQAQKIRSRCQAVILSVDEIILALFGQDVGKVLDDYVAKTKKYLYQKSLEVIDSGIDVILDWGFWTREEREHARRFYSSRNIECEMQYIDIDSDEWRMRMQKRNQSVQEKKFDAYYVSEDLVAKFENIFQEPERDEVDVCIEQ